MFHVGQKVVCVDDNFPSRLERRVATGGSCTVRVPRWGTVYTIRAIDPGDRGVYLRLEEIINPVCVSILDGVMEPNFRDRRFRPLVERKTDIGFAHDILRKINEPADADRERFETALSHGS